jgi:ferric-dicitrate binding protein FerR (iron transport regulator)
LNGEAFFEVQKTGNPFIVTTNFGEIEVRGTFFNVNAFSGENFQTTLVQGAVTVKTNNGTKAIKLNPGQQAELEGKDLIVKNVETDLFDSWKYGKLIFRNEYLPVVAKRLERWYNVKIELANDKRLSEISYTGTLEMETFSEVLQLLRITAPINYSYDEKTRIIKITYRKT